MSQDSRLTADEENARGCCGCFGWLRRLFRKKKRGRRQKHKDLEPSLTPLASDGDVFENNEECEEKENATAVASEDVGEARQDDEVVKEEKEPVVVKTWAEEVDEAEEKGLDVFAPISCLPNTATVHRDADDASPEKEATAATASGIKMSATQRRRARRKALAAARKASQGNEAPVAAAAETSQPDDSDSSEQPQEPDGMPVSPAPYVGAHGSDGRASVLEAPVATAIYSGTSATRRRRARRKALNRACEERGTACCDYRSKTDSFTPL